MKNFVKRTTAPFQALGRRLGIDENQLMPAAIFGVSAVASYFGIELMDAVYANPANTMQRIAQVTLLTMGTVAIPGAGFVLNRRQARSGIASSSLQRPHNAIASSMDYQIFKADIAASVAGACVGVMGHLEQTGMLQTVANLNSIQGDLTTGILLVSGAVLLRAVRDSNDSINAAVSLRSALISSRHSPESSSTSPT
jgi:hypothetical protein